MKRVVVFLTVVGTCAALAQGYGPAIPRRVTSVVITPDGGPLRVGIDDSTRLDVSATTPPDTTLSVSGVNGTILRTDLGGVSLNALLHPTCTQGLPEILQAGPTPIQVPRGLGHAHPPTAWVAVNLSGNRRLCCMPSLDGGVPTIDCDPPTDGGVGLGFVVPAGGRLEITGDAFIETNYCRADGTMPAQTVNINAWEESCVQ